MITQLLVQQYSKQQCTENRIVQVRISVDDYDFIKEMDVNFSKIWQIGFEKRAIDYSEFLQKKISRLLREQESQEKLMKIVRDAQ